MSFSNPPLVYCDTSVFGGCFDDEFAEASLRLMEAFRVGQFHLLISPATVFELQRAPGHVKELPKLIPAVNKISMGLVEAAEELQDAYLSEGIVGPSSRLDALHVAYASVGGATMIVSWIFRHIVQYEKIQGYPEVNRRFGYFEVPIYSPLEVV